MAQKRSRKSNSHEDNEVGNSLRFLTQEEIKGQLRKIKGQKQKRQVAYELGNDDSSDEDLVGSVPTRNPLM